MANKIVQMRPNGSPQFLQWFQSRASVSATGDQVVGDTYAYDTQEYGDSTSIRLEAFFNSVNSATVKSGSIQVSNTPDFAVHAVVATISLANLAGGKAESTVVFRRGQNLRPAVISAAGVTTELTTIDRTKRLYFRFVINKATAGDAVSLEGFRLFLQREMYEYKYGVSLQPT